MLDQVLEVFDVVPDYDLSIMKEKQTLFDITANILNNIRKVLEEVRPDVVLVHGDTSTTFVTALACFYLQIPVGHVEAGLRTYNIYSPYPEEFNRQAVGIISNYNFAPTEKAKENLIKEGKKKESIYVTGNTAIDALKTTVKKEYNHPELEWARGSRLILITAHRRENLGEPMKAMFKACLLYTSQSNKGISVARNNGLRVAKGRYCCFCDSDDFIDFNYIEVLYKIMKEKNADISCCRFKGIYADSTVIKSNTGTIIEYSSMEALNNLYFNSGPMQQVSNKINIVVWNKLYKREMCIRDSCRI